jgi:hypothetical protein
MVKTKKPTTKTKPKVIKKKTKKTIKQKQSVNVNVVNNITSKPRRTSSKPPQGQNQIPHVSPLLPYMNSYSNQIANLSNEINNSKAMYQQAVNNKDFYRQQVENNDLRALTIQLLNTKDAAEVGGINTSGITVPTPPNNTYNPPPPPPTSGPQTPQKLQETPTGFVAPSAAQLTQGIGKLKPTTQIDESGNVTATPPPRASTKASILAKLNRLVRGIPDAEVRKQLKLEYETEANSITGSHDQKRTAYNTLLDDYTRRIESNSGAGGGPSSGKKSKKK